MLAAAEQIFILLFFILIGFFLCKTKVINADGAGFLSKLCVYVFVPCKVFQTFYSQFTVNYIKEKYVFLLAGFAVVTLVAIVNIPISCLFAKRKTYKWSVFHYSFTIPNYGYVGYALIESLFGQASLLNMMVLCIPLNLYTYTVGFSMLTAKSENRPSLTKRLMTPINISMILGMAIGLSGLKVPSTVGQIIQFGGNCFSPIAMILIGMTVSEYALRPIFTNAKAYLAVAFRLILIPALLFAVLLPFNIPAEVKRIAIITLAIPCGCNTIVFPKLIGEDCRDGVSLVIISTLLSLATLPIWCMIVK